MSAAKAVEQYQFVRRTTLNPDEYRKNFRQIDCDVIEVLTSPEADQVTSQMSKVYLRLTNAPQQYWERQGALRFSGCEREGKWVTAWEQLVSTTGVASATARKALTWMNDRGIIGYYAGKNGVGIRIFINRAASSIGQRPAEGQKNLRLVPASTCVSRTSADEAGFKESNADIENLELTLIPHAPQNGAAGKHVNGELTGNIIGETDTRPTTLRVMSLDGDAIIQRIAREVLPQVRSAAAREHERTREWFIKDALPKAVRVAQRSAYDVLRANGAINEPRARGSRRGQSYCNDREVGKHAGTLVSPRQLNDEEINELADSCVALQVTQGRTIEHILNEMSVEAGGFLLPEDSSKVRAKAELMTVSDKATQNYGKES